MRSLKDILIEARKLIANEDHWCQGRYAEDEHGCETDPVVGNPAAYCALGAIRHVLGVVWGEPSAVSAKAEEALSLAAADINPAVSGMSELNDSATHAHVLLAYDIAIGAV